MKKCTPGVNGTCLLYEHHKEAEKSNVTYSRTNMFCWMFYQENTGSTVPVHDLEVIRTNLFLGSSVFGCESYRVFSDVAVWLSPGKVETVKVEDVDNNFYFAKRKFNGHWINSNMHIAAWKKIKEENMWASKDWTIKVDQDAVFLPSRLREKLLTYEVTENGIYIENCEYQQYGFFGPLEIFSRQAAATLMVNLDDCKAALNYMSGSDKNVQSEPWGEDVFVQRCMDLHGVDKVPDFTVYFDTYCLAKVPKSQKKNFRTWRPDCATTNTAVIHPFLTPKHYFECLKATQR